MSVPRVDPHTEWWLYRRKAVGWFAAAALGAWAGAAAPFPMGFMVAAAGALVALGVCRRATGAVWGALLFVTLALVVSYLSASRVAEFERWEAHYPRGERRVLRGRVADVLPHSGGRLALIVEDQSVSSSLLGTGRLWVRLVADASDVFAALNEAPPDAGGAIHWPVRVYPFTPRGNPGEFDSRLWAMRRGYLATAYLDRPRGGIAGKSGEPSPTGRDPSADLCALSEAAQQLYEAFGIRNRLRQVAWRWRCHLVRGRTGDTAAVAAAMLLGQKDLIEADLQQAFSRSGLGHLLAVSGLHVGFIVLLVLPLAKVISGPPQTGEGARVAARQWLGSTVVSGAVLGFVFLTGAPASAARAGLMAILRAGGAALKRRSDPWQLLAVAGTCLLVVQPLFLFDLGFQMSFLAVSGILAAVEAAAPSQRESTLGLGVGERVRRALTGSLAVTLGAQIATAPVTAFAFSSISWISPVINLIGVPLGALAVPVLATGVILADIGPALGHRIIDLGHWVLGLLVSLARAVPSWAELEVPMPSPAAGLGWLGMWYGAAIVIRALRRPAAPAMLRVGRKLLLAGAVLCAGALCLPVAKGLLGVTEVWVLDVGQGDAVLVRSGWGRSVMIDGGGVPGAAATGGYDVGERRVVPTLKRLGVRGLAAVISTHPHEDHVHGLAAVISQRRVDGVYASAAKANGAAYRAFLQAAAAKNLEVKRLNVGDRFHLEPGLTLTVLASGDLSEWEGFSRPRREPSINDRSIVLLLEHPTGRALFLGDLETQGQARVMAQGEQVETLSIADVDVLLIPHHGDRVTAATGLLDVTRPKLALISVGPNRYGHPSPELLEALAARSIRVARTDQNGAVVVQFWPWGMRVATVRRPRGGPL